MNREDKQKFIEELRDRLSRASAMVVTEYKGLTVAEMSDLRMKLGKSSVEYKVIKNTLARIAIEETPMAPGRDSFAGPVGIALSYEDPVSAVKGVLDFSKENDKLKVLGGVMDGRFFEVSDLGAIACLPSRDVMLGMIASAMASPLSKLAYGLSATLSGLLNAMNALRTKKEGEA